MPGIAIFAAVAGVPVSRCIRQQKDDQGTSCRDSAVATKTTKDFLSAVETIRTSNCTVATGDSRRVDRFVSIDAISKVKGRVVDFDKRSDKDQAAILELSPCMEHWTRNSNNVDMTLMDKDAEAKIAYINDEVDVSCEENKRQNLCHASIIPKSSQ